MSEIRNLKVDADTLKSRGREVEGALEGIKKSFQQLNAAINNTSSYWKGEAGDLHRKLYNDKAKEINKLLERLGDYPVDMLKIAGIFLDVERENTQSAMKLGADGIS